MKINYIKSNNNKNKNKNKNKGVKYILKNIFYFIIKIVRYIVIIQLRILQKLKLIIIDLYKSNYKRDVFIIECKDIIKDFFNNLKYGHKRKYQILYWYYYFVAEGQVYDYLFNTKMNELYSFMLQDFVGSPFHHSYEKNDLGRIKPYGLWTNSRYDEIYMSLDTRIIEKRRWLHFLIFYGISIILSIKIWEGFLILILSWHLSYELFNVWIEMSMLMKDQLDDEENWEYIEFTNDLRYLQYKKIWIEYKIVDYIFISQNNYRYNEEKLSWYFLHWDIIYNNDIKKCEYLRKNLFGDYIDEIDYFDIMKEQYIEINIEEIKFHYIEPKIIIKKYILSQNDEIIGLNWLKSNKNLLYNPTFDWITPKQVVSKNDVYEGDLWEIHDNEEEDLLDLIDDLIDDPLLIKLFLYKEGFSAYLEIDELLEDYESLNKIIFIQIFNNGYLILNKKKIYNILKDNYIKIFTIKKKKNKNYNLKKNQLFLFYNTKDLIKIYLFFIKLKNLPYLKNKFERNIQIFFYEEKGLHNIYLQNKYYKYQLNKLFVNDKYNNR